MELRDLLDDNTLQFLREDQEADLDTLFLAAYAQDVYVHVAPSPPPTGSATPTHNRNQPHPSTSTVQAPRFATPISDEDIVQRRKSAVPKKTNEDTKYCTKVWEEWCQYRREYHHSDIPTLHHITRTQLQHWLTRFVLEVCKKDGTEYPPDTLHHICSGIARHMRANICPSCPQYLPRQ